MPKEQFFSYTMATILQLYYRKNILPFDEMIMMVFLVLDLQAW
jgi:hypothetical protein